MIRRLSAALALFALAGCAGAPPPSVPCSHFPAYSQLEQGVLGSELPNDGPQTQIEIEDYTKLMDECPKPAAPPPTPTIDDVH